MKKLFQGPVTVLGDNIDTDQILPGRFLDLTLPEEIGRRCLYGVDPELAARFPKGGIVVAGRNFGCGSSREHAPIALVHMGAAAVLADSFARIFFRNAINLGLPLIVCPGIAAAVKDGEEIAVDLDAGEAKLLASGQTLLCEKLGEHAMKILEAGGIKELFRHR